MIIDSVNPMSKKGRRGYFGNGVPRVTFKLFKFLFRWLADTINAFMKAKSSCLLIGSVDHCTSENVQKVMFHIYQCVTN
jgi:hypothetical protein